LLAGAAVGAVAALLLTPKTGKENRKFLKDQASRLGGKAGEIFGKRHAGEPEHAGNGAQSRHRS
jgi:gas vesicle protein